MLQKLKKKVRDLATSLALQKSERTGKDYTECINTALDEACKRLGISSTEFIKMFL